MNKTNQFLDILFAFSCSFASVVILMKNLPLEKIGSFGYWGYLMLAVINIVFAIANIVRFGVRSVMMERHSETMAKIKEYGDKEKTE